MKKLLRILFMAVFCSALCLAFSHLTLKNAQAKFKIDIYAGSGVHKTSMAIPLLRNLGDKSGPGNLEKDLADALTDDMMMTGFFDVLPRSIYLENPRIASIKQGEFNFDDWSVIGSEMLIKGGFVVDGNHISIEFRLFDVIQRRLIIGKKYEGNTEDYYRIAHKFSNEIIYTMTGEPGSFGTQVAYTSGGRGRTELYVIDVDGRNKKKLTRLGGSVDSPAWSPDGKSILFTYAREGERASLWIINADGKNLKKICEYPGVVLTPAFHPTGKYFILTLSKDGNSELYTMNLDGSDVKRLTNTWYIEVSPSFSPDGKSLAYACDRGGQPQIFKMNADGTNAARISFVGGYNSDPSWSPKGDKIAYQSLSGNNFHVYVMNTDGYEVTSFGLGEHPSFSPDGRSIVISSPRSGGRGLFIINIDGSFIKKLTSGADNDMSPAWSPRLAD